MSFSVRELLGGRPRWLYTFARANQVWRLSGAGSAVTVAATGMTYAPAFITHDRIQQNADVGAETVMVRVALTTPIADALREVSTHPILLRIEKHQPQDAENVPIVRAFGDVARVRLANGMIEFDLVTGEASLGLAFPNKKVERQCQWATFSAESGLEERSFSYATTLTAIDLRTVTVASIGFAFDGYYHAGQLKLGNGPHADRVFVDYHVGPVFTLAGKLPSWVVEAFRAFDEDDGPPVDVTLVAGDDKMFTTWRDRFGAVGVDRFLGFDLLPATDPMQTGVDRTPLQRTPYAGGTVSGTEGSATPPLPFRIYPEASETDTDGTVTLRVADPEERITSVEFRSNPTGDAGDWSAWDAADFSSTPPTYVATASKVDGLIIIEVRVTYLDEAEAPQTLTAQWALSGSVA